MKYVLLIYSNPASWAHPMFLHQHNDLSPEQRERMLADAGALTQEITESGELVGGEPLADPLHARTVRVRDGVAVPTDGPFVEAKEQLAGYFVVDCDSPQRAAEIAARLPDARFCAVEVRPVMEFTGMEM